MLLSISIREHAAKNCNFYIKVNSSCNCNWLPPTQGHSLWTSRSPYSRLTLSMPYWTPLENNSSIGNFQGTGFEKTKNVSLVAATHIICHSHKKAIIHRQGWFVIFKVTEQFLKLTLNQVTSANLVMADSRNCYKRQMIFSSGRQTDKRGLKMP